VIHGDVEDEAKALLDEAAARFNPQETYLSYATAVLGVHIGPGTLGIVFEWLP
jgi:fatty acid-binding protein DegV